MYQLYINNQEVNLTGSTDINFNYQQSDLTNPTIIKSSFSKTVTVPGNTHNSNIFCKIFKGKLFKKAPAAKLPQVLFDICF